MRLTRLLIFSALTFSISLSAASTEFFTDGNRIEVFSDSLIEAERYSVQVVAPDGRIWQETFEFQPIAEIDLDMAFSSDLPDGQYSFEIRPHAASQTHQVPDELRGLETTSPAVPDVVTGTVTVKAGVLVDPNQSEPISEVFKLSETASPSETDEETIDDFVINDDLIVTGSACIGFDCVNGETFSFDTVKLKENNLRISFIDTSTVSGFPAGDWQLRANDSASGGADHFSIDWLGTGANTGNSPVSTPFRVDGNAPTNALRVSSAGRVGLRTANPVLDLHIATNNTPGIRYEQTAAGGFSPQTWDIAGNEANFFIRDVTNGSRLPFRIRPGAPTSSIDIASSGNVGFGTASPSAAIHMKGDTAWPAPMAILENTLADPGASHNLELRSNAVPVLSFVDTNPTAGSADRVSLSFRKDGEFRITNPLEPGPEFRLTQTGNLIIKGDLIANGVTYASSHHLKENFSNINPGVILSALTNLTISQWNYKKDDVNVTHIGPTAEDFHAAFGLNGDNDARISTSDIGGVALASIQALNLKLESKSKKITQLESELAELRMAVEQLKQANL
jgi:hypothetical protein